MGDDLKFDSALALLGTPELLSLFGSITDRESRCGWSYVVTDTIGRKTALDKLHELGLVRLEDGEFRTDQLSGRVKVGEFICSLTQFGRDVAAFLRLN